MGDPRSEKQNTTIGRIEVDILAGDEVCYSIHSIKREHDSRPKESNGKEVPALSGTSRPRHWGKVRASPKPEVSGPDGIAKIRPGPDGRSARGKREEQE